MNFRCAFDSSSARSRRLSQFKCLGSRGGYLVAKLHITLVKGSGDGLDQLGYQDTTGWGSQPGILKLPSQQVPDQAPGKFGIIIGYRYTIIIMINLFLFSAHIVLPRYPNYEIQINMRQLACTCIPITYGLLQLFFCSR